MSRGKENVGLCACSRWKLSLITVRNNWQFWLKSMRWWRSKKDCCATAGSLPETTREISRSKLTNGLLEILHRGEKKKEKKSAQENYLILTFGIHHHETLDCFSRALPIFISAHILHAEALQTAPFVMLLINTPPKEASDAQSAWHRNDKKQWLDVLSCCAQSALQQSVCSIQPSAA